MKTENKGLLFEIGSWISDIVELGLLFIVTSLPLITIGTSCSALYYAVAKSIRCGEGHPVKEYFHAWKENFVKGTISSVLLLVGGYFLFISWRNTAYDEIKLAVVFAVAMLITAAIYYYAILARFDLSVTQIWRASLFLLSRYFLRTLGLIVTLILCGIVIYYIPVIVPIIVPLYALYCTVMIEPVFRKMSAKRAEGLWYDKL